MDDDAAGGEVSRPVLQGITPVSMPDDDEGIFGELHPTNWIMAAGYFEKERGTVIKGDPRSDHQDRFFVLTRMALVWFKRPTDADLLGEEKGKLLLKDLQYCEITRGSGHLKTIMRLTTGSKSISLRCNSSAYAELWASIIKKAQDGSDVPELDTPVEKATGIIAMGYLEKSRDGAVRTGWCTRFFVLTARYLYYFKCTDPSKELFGEERSRFSTREMIEIKVRDTDPAIVDITLQRKVKADRVVEVRATSPGLAAEWARRLNTVAEKARTAVTPGTHSTPGILDSMNNRLTRLKRGSIMEGLAVDMKNLLPNNRLNSDSDISTRSPEGSPMSAKSGPSGLTPQPDSDTPAAAANSSDAPTAKSKPPSANKAMGLTAGYLVASNILLYILCSYGLFSLFGLLAFLTLNGMSVFVVMQTPLWAPPPPPPKRQRPKLAAKPAQVVTSPGGSTTAIGKPAMGSTLKLVPKVDESSMEGSKSFDSGETMAASDAPGKYFRLRIGPNYKKAGKKAPSEESYYEFIGGDLLNAPDNLDHVAADMELPAAFDASDPALQGPLPKLLVVNAQLPFEPPSLYKKAKRGQGCSIVLCFRVTPEAQKMAANLPSAPPALRLLDRYFSEAVHGEKHPSLAFKAICHVLNIKELGLGSMVEGYNGKPVLIKLTGCTYKGEHYFEVDVNAHRFGFITRQAIAGLKHRICEMEIRAGFTVEGSEDEELPECVMACCDLHRIDVDQGADIL